MHIIPSGDYSGQDLSGGIHSGDALGAKFTGTNFRGANLTRVRNLNCAQLRSAKCTCGAKLPLLLVLCKGRCKCKNCNH